MGLFLIQGPAFDVFVIGELDSAWSGCLYLTSLVAAADLYISPLDSEGAATSGLSFPFFVFWPCPVENF
jgi:hypothetical protein